MSQQNSSALLFQQRVGIHRLTGLTAFDKIGVLWIVHKLPPNETIAHRVPTMKRNGPEGRQRGQASLPRWAPLEKSIKLAELSR